jgi:hypothetical protein
VGTLLSPAKKTSKKIRFFQKIGFLTEQLRQKNPIFSKNRIFNGAATSKKNPIFLKNRIFNGAATSKKSDFFKKSDF